MTTTSTKFKFSLGRSTLLPLFTTFLLLNTISASEQPWESLTWADIAANVPYITKEQVFQAMNWKIDLLLHLNANHSDENKRALYHFSKAIPIIDRKYEDIKLVPVWVDCEKDEHICSELKVFYYPQTVLWIASRTVKLDFRRNYKQFSDQVIKYRNGGHSIYCEKRDCIDKLKEEHIRIFFYVGHQDIDFDIFKRLSAGYDYIQFGHTFDRSDLASHNGIYFYETFEGTTDMINGPHGPDRQGRMDEFISKYTRLLRSLSDYVMKRIFVTDQEAVLIFYPDNPEERGVIIPFWHAAQYIRRDMLCVQVPINEDRNTKELMHLLGVENPYSPAVRIVANKHGYWKFYQMRDKIQVETVKQFYKDYRNDDLKRFYKSERPERAVPGQLKQLVGKTFTKSVQNEDFHVVVFLFSKENHTLSERILKIGKMAMKFMARYEKIKFAKYDTFYNDNKHLPQRGWPQIRIYKIGEKDYPKFYPGFYNVQEVVQWISDELGVKNPYTEEIEKLKKNKKGREPEQDI